MLFDEEGWDRLYYDFQERFVNPRSLIDEDLKLIKTKSQRTALVMSFIEEEIKKCIAQQLSPESDQVRRRLERAYRIAEEVSNGFEGGFDLYEEERNWDNARELGRLTWQLSEDRSEYERPIKTIVNGIFYELHQQLFAPSVIKYINQPIKSKFAERIMITALIESEMSAFLSRRYLIFRLWFWFLPVISKWGADFLMHLPSKLVFSMLDVHVILQRSPVASIRHFREKLSRSEDFGVVWPEALFLLLDDMERRGETEF